MPMPFTSQGELYLGTRNAYGIHFWSTLQEDGIGVDMSDVHVIGVPHRQIQRCIIDKS
jgi:hypothetical protein